MKRGVVFGLIIFGILQLAKSLAAPVDEAWLVAGFLAILVSYWVPPIPGEKYVAWAGTNLLMVIGIYFCGFKLPRLFVSQVSYPLASLLCILLFMFCWWLIVARRTRQASNIKR